MQGIYGRDLTALSRDVISPGAHAFFPAFCTVITVFLASFAHATVTETVRAALVIGNAHYESVVPLKNSVNDAHDVCAELGRLGFKTSCHFDVRTRIQLRAIVQDYAESLSTNSVSFVYYAGHAIQASGENYLIPTSVQMRNAASLTSEAVSVSYLMHQLGTTHDFLNVIVLDACRDNPFASSTAEGLAPVTDVPSGTMILYATAADEVAIDGAGKGRNGVMTSHLLSDINEPGTVDDLFKRVSLGVQKDTETLGRPQKPALYTNFGGQFCLVKCTTLEISQAKIESLQARVAAGDSDAKRELEAAKRDKEKLLADLKKKDEEAAMAKKKSDQKNRDGFVPPAF